MEVSNNDKFERTKEAVKGEAYAIIGLDPDGKFSEIPDNVESVISKVNGGQLQTEVMTLVEDQVKKAVDATLLAVLGDTKSSPLKVKRVMKAFE